MNKRLIAIILIVIVILVAAGAWFFLKPSPSVNITLTNNTSSSVNTANQHINQTNNTTTNITAAKAKELAGKYVGIGVTLETPTLTTYKNIQVWIVPVATYSPNKTYLDPIYINAKTGVRVT
ncbi:MAG: hypothetical protein HY802_03910 [Methanobacterium sp.]|nr:hypothetical protein [Methanobacterium sp.]